jgi:hypothetical protein
MKSKHNLNNVFLNIIRTPFYIVGKAISHPIIQDTSLQNIKAGSALVLCYNSNSTNNYNTS